MQPAPFQLITDSSPNYQILDHKLPQPQSSKLPRNQQTGTYLYCRQDKNKVYWDRYEQYFTVHPQNVRMSEYVSEHAQLIQSGQLVSIKQRKDKRGNCINEISEKNISCQEKVMVQHMKINKNKEDYAKTTDHQKYLSNILMN